MKLKSLTEEEFALLLQKYVVGKVKLNEMDEKKIANLFTKPATIQDVFNLINSVVKPFERAIAQLMEITECHDIMLDKLGATEELWEEVKKQHEKEKKELAKKQKEQMQKLFDDAAKNGKIDPEIAKRLKAVAKEKEQDKESKDEK